MPHAEPRPPQSSFPYFGRGRQTFTADPESYAPGTEGSYGVASWWQMRVAQPRNTLRQRCEERFQICGPNNDDSSVQATLTPTHTDKGKADRLLEMPSGQRPPIVVYEKNPTQTYGNGNTHLKLSSPPARTLHHLALRKPVDESRLPEPPSLGGASSGRAHGGLVAEATWEFPKLRGAQHQPTYTIINMTGA